ncbi:MAG: TIGR00153 family protein [Deltaproteobacteria bacterium]|nr:TIGR00153 family protein [Deltaproteobacteria bacterium]MBW2071753.1 TIGR00153 family protein [Deltaproteobacteria bacterium]
MTFLREFLSHNKKEKVVVQSIREHICLLCSAIEAFREALEKNNKHLMRSIADLEREGDSIRREIISKIYEGAFLPYLRPDLCRFVEIIDDVFDVLKDTSLNCLDATIPESIRDECVRVAFLNTEMCKMLLLTFDAMLRGENLREKALAIRIYEKKIDDIKFELFRTARKVDIGNFWEGQVLSHFLSGLTEVSDIIEDATDHLQIISVSMR